jgi:acyl-coenzyme A synthetase/AMP-(fatty) acid ligase
VNLVEPILRHGRLQPTTIAIVDEDRSITYGELAELVQRTAGHLRALGVRRGDYVGLCLKDNWQHITALLAVAHMGAVAVQIETRSRPAERARIVDAFQLRLALVAPGSEAGIGCPKVSVDAAWRLTIGQSAQNIEAAHEWCVALGALASSGTTGLPKFTLATHLQYYFHIVSYLEIIPPKRHCYLSSLPLYFSSGRVACLAHLWRGDTVVFSPELFSPEEFVDNIGRHKITVARVAPTVLRRLLQIAGNEKPVLTAIDLLVSTGSPLFSDEKLEIARKVSPRLCEMYGAAAIGPIAVLRPEEISLRPASVGRPFSLIDVEIVDENDQPLDNGFTGQLRCRGPSLTTPIPNSPAVPSPEFRNGWYYPGELAVVDAGYVFLRGRVSEVIFRSGAKIFPSEIEAVLQDHASIAEAAVVGRALPNNEQEVAAYVIAKAEVTTGQLLAHCRQRLTPYKVPRQIHIVSELPRNPSGKVDKRALAQTTRP